MQFCFFLFWYHCGVVVIDVLVIVNHHHYHHYDQSSLVVLSSGILWKRKPFAHNVERACLSPYDENLISTYYIPFLAFVQQFYITGDKLLNKRWLSLKLEKREFQS